MTQEEFIEILKEKDYSYEMEGDKVIVNRKGNVYLSALTSLPPDVEFRNERGVYLNGLTSLPPGVEFKNRGGVYLRALTSLPPGVVFENGGGVELDSLTYIPPGVEFKNEGGVDLRSLVGGWFKMWSGNIEGIDEKRLLNKMIKDGVFER
jgi:hypothetical protein